MNEMSQNITENSASAPRVPKKKHLALKILVGLVVVAAAGFGGWYLFIQRPAVDDAPPSLKLAGSTLQGSTVTTAGNFLLFDENDASGYQSPANAAFTESPRGVQYFYADQNVTVDDIIDNIKPVDGLRVLIAHYSAEEACYNTYPKGPYVLKKDDPEGQGTCEVGLTYSIQANSAFAIVADRSFEYNSNVLKSFNTPADSFDLKLADNKTGWVLRPLPASASAVALDARSKNRIEQIWQLTNGEFRQLNSFNDIDYNSQYKMVWLKLKVKGAAPAADEDEDTPADLCPNIDGIQETMPAGFKKEGQDCVTICGDGLIKGSESCDDGNIRVKDGCYQCNIDSGWECTGEPSVCTQTTDLCPNIDGIQATVPDGFKKSGQDCVKTCNDGNMNNGDGCSSTNTVERGWECIGTPSVCKPICGDGIVISGLRGALKVLTEECDDGNTRNEDGCSSECKREDGWFCINEPDKPSNCVIPDFGGYNLDSVNISLPSTLPSSSEEPSEPSAEPTPTKIESVRYINNIENELKDTLKEPSYRWIDDTMWYAEGFYGEIIDNVPRVVVAAAVVQTTPGTGSIELKEVEFESKGTAPLTRDDATYCLGQSEWRVALLYEEGNNLRRSIIFRKLNTNILTPMKFTSLDAYDAESAYQIPAGSKAIITLEMYGTDHCAPISIADKDRQPPYKSKADFKRITYSSEGTGSTSTFVGTELDRWITWKDKIYSSL